MFILEGLQQFNGDEKDAKKLKAEGSVKIDSIIKRCQNKVTSLSKSL